MTDGQVAYELELRARPAYAGGAPRKPWDQLCEIARWSWERNPTPRWLGQRIEMAEAMPEKREG